MKLLAFGTLAAALTLAACASDGGGNPTRANPGGSTATGSLSPVGGSGSGSATFSLAATASVGDQPGAIALDNQGNAWISDTTAAATVSSGVRKFSSAGLLLGSFATAFPTTGPVVLDGGQNVWASGGTNLYEFNASGTPVATISNATDVVFDNAGNRWTGGSSVLLLNTNNALIATLSTSSGTTVKGTGGDVWIWQGLTLTRYPGTVGASSSFTLPNSASTVAVSPSGNVWVLAANQGPLLRLDSAGHTLSSTAISGLAGQDIAFDASGDGWVVDAVGRLDEIDPNGHLLAQATVPGLTGTPGPAGGWTAVGPDGRVWATAPGSRLVAVYKH